MFPRRPDHDGDSGGGIWLEDACGSIGDGATDAFEEWTNVQFRDVRLLGTWYPLIKCRSAGDHRYKHQGPDLLVSGAK